MVIRLTSTGTATLTEVFHVPGDYPEYETESGARLARGHWWVYITEAGVPDAYPIGPFDSVGEAVTDAEMHAAWEPWEEES